MEDHLDTKFSGRLPIAVVIGGGALRFLLGLRRRDRGPREITCAHSPVRVGRSTLPRAASLGAARHSGFSILNSQDLACLQVRFHIRSRTEAEIDLRGHKAVTI